MARDTAHLIHDILLSIQRIEEITQGTTFEEFQANWRVSYAVQRAIEIISEASRGIPVLTPTRPEIPWRSVRDIGNVIRHKYHGLADQIIWNVVVDELPRLKVAIEAIAGKTANPQP